MARNIQKLIKGGKVIFPATSTDAVIDPLTEESLADLLNYLLPINTTFTVDRDVIEVGKETVINYTWGSELGGKDITDLCTYTLDAAEVSGSSFTENLTPNQAQEYKRILKISYNGREYESEARIKAIQSSYYGAISKTDEIDADTILGLEGKMLMPTKATEINNVKLDAQRFVIAYPSSLGDLNSIKDINGLEYMGDFDKTNISIYGIPYNVYAMKTICTIEGDGYGFIFK